MSLEGLTILSRRVVLGDSVAPAQITVRDGRIARIDSAVLAEASARHLDVGDLVVMPGLVDTHVHVNEPGRTDWEGFRSAGRASAAGGVTTIVAMPLNCTPAATTADALAAEARAAQGQSLVDYGFWGGIVPGNTFELAKMWRGGALGFKCFLVDSGVDDFAGVGLQDLHPALAETARLGAVVLVHAEDRDLIDSARSSSGLDRSPRSYRAFLASRPPESEVRAIEMMVRLSRGHRARVHIVHVSSASSLSVLRQARSEGLRLTAETCPHYLALTAEDIADGATAYKCAPPIRDRANQGLLWDGLREGSIGMVVSDHSPCPPALKELGSGSFSRAWGGIASLQLGLSIVWSHARVRGYGITDVARWMCGGPASLAGLGATKGRIEVGYDADLVVFDPDLAWTVRAGDLHHRHKVTPYDGAPLTGAVRATFVRGRQVFASPGFARVDPLGDDGLATEAAGQWVKRTRE